VYVG